MNTTPCGVVGNGRMAAHFTRYLSLSGIPYRQWARSTHSDDPVEFFKDSRAIFLLISDDAIEPFLQEHPGLLNMNPIHFSGSLYLDSVPSLHPLMTFSEELYPLEKYQKIPFISEKGRISLQDVLPELINPSEAIDSEKKSLYHSLCVMSGNFTTMLWQKAFGDFSEKLALDEKLLYPYLDQITNNLKSDWKSALTGPLARKDRKTISRNIEVLQGDSYQEVYRSFAATVLKGETL